MSLSAKERQEIESFMTSWEKGSPMRTFIYYLQRATCGALTYLVFHQLVLGLRLMQLDGFTRAMAERILEVLSLPGDILVLNFDAIRPLNLPPPLATFFLTIIFYFVSVWLGCFFYNWALGKTFLGNRKDPFTLKPREDSQA